MQFTPISSLLILGLFGSFAQAYGQQDPKAISTCPVTISSPGHYELTADLTCGGGNGITITSSDVHLELKGHKITAGVGAFIAIAVNPGGPVVLDRVRISGPGLITSGVANTFLSGVLVHTANHSEVRELTVVGSRQEGIEATNCNFLTIKSNVVGRNQTGIFLPAVYSSTVSDNDASGNGNGMEGWHQPSFFKKPFRIRRDLGVRSHCRQG